MSAPSASVLPSYSSSRRLAQQPSAVYGPAQLNAHSDRGDAADALAFTTTTVTTMSTEPVGDRANQLALRFAHMLARRYSARGLLLDDSECDATLATELRAARKKKKATVTLSKSCAMQRRRPTGAKPSRLARARMASREVSTRVQEEEEREYAQLEATIRELRSTIANLEQSQLLADSALLTWRMNRSGVAVNVCRQYHVQFSHGYDPENPALAARSATTRAFIASAVEDDVITRDFRGVEASLGQWRKYTTCYDNFTSRLCSLTLIDDDDRFVSVSTAAEMRFVFSPNSLKTLYPHLYEQLETSAEARAIAAKLFGRECRLAFDFAFHFNQRGKVFATESRVHLASALLNLISDPIATMKVLNASLITEDGHWKTADIHEKSNVLPKSLLS